MICKKEELEKIADHSKLYYSCPFCGSFRVRLNATWMGAKNDCWCECDECGAKGPHDEKTQRALELWNGRSWAKLGMMYESKPMD